jgi:VIT1/CCC1 family predicted Fe2+/Mn2+ transporter
VSGDERTKQAAAETRATPKGSEVHHDHRDVAGGWLRPAVFGAMDGLVSNFSLMAGVTGGSTSTHVVVLAGLAGLAAGAFSMAAGEYTSVASQAELAAAEIDIERREIAEYPAAELAELTRMYVSRGVEPLLAAEVARQISADPERALEIHTREELGVTPGELPSPWLAAGSSFVAFAAGAALPVLPYAFGANGLAPSAVVTLGALFGCGALVSRVTTRSWWYSGARQTVLGAAAAAVTYGVGSVVGS